MKSVRKLSIFCALLISILHTKQAFSQYYFYNNKYYDKDLIFEIGVSTGLMNCITDVGGSKGKGGLYINDFTWSTFRANYGLYAGIMYQEAIGARLEVTRGTVMAADSLLKGSPKAADRFKRNLHFTSKIKEIALLAEFHPLNLKYKDDLNRLSPYLVAGVGLFTFNPQARVSGDLSNLRDLRTEGQGFAEYPHRNVYNLTQPNLLAGGGFKLEVSALLNVRFEFLHRFLFTDYLDDVSTTYIDPFLYEKYFPKAQAELATSWHFRGGANVKPGDKRTNSNAKDAYMTFNLKIGLTLGRDKR